MKLPSLQSLVLGTVLATTPAAAYAQNCSAIPDFRVALTQQVGNGPVSRKVGFPQTNKPGSAIHLAFTYDTTKNNKFALATDPAGGKAVANAPAYLTDKDGLAFTGKDLANKKVDATFYMQLQNKECMRLVQLVGVPEGPRARAAVVQKATPQVKHDTVFLAPPAAPPAPSANATATASANVYIILGGLEKKDTASGATTPTPVYAPSAQLSIFGTVMGYNGSKNSGSGYHTENKLTAKQPSLSIGGSALVPYSTIGKDGKATVKFVAEANYRGGNFDVTLTNPAGKTLAHEDAHFTLMDASVAAHLLMDGKLGARIGVNRISRQIDEIAVETPAHPAFTSKNPTVSNTYFFAEVVAGSAAMNVSGGYAKQSLTHDDINGGSGWTVAATMDQRLATHRTLPIMGSVRYRRITGDNVATPDGIAPFRASRFNAKVEVQPLPLITVGIEHERAAYFKGVSQPESWTVGFAGITIPLHQLTNKNGGNK